MNANGLAPKLELTAAQKSAIYQSRPPGEEQSRAESVCHQRREPTCRR